MCLKCIGVVVGVVRRYIDFLILLLIPTPLVLVFSSSIPTSLFIFQKGFSLFR